MKSRRRGRPRKYNTDEARKKAKAKQTKESRSRLRKKKKRITKKQKIDLIEQIVDHLDDLGKLDVYDTNDYNYEEHTINIDDKVYEVYVSYRLIEDLREVRVHIYRGKLHILCWLYWKDQNTYYKFPLVANKFRVHLYEGYPCTHPPNRKKD